MQPSSLLPLALCLLAAPASALVSFQVTGRSLVLAVATLRFPRGLQVDVQHWQRRPAGGRASLICPDPWLTGSRCTSSRPSAGPCRRLGALWRT
uniref:Cathepsin D n=1 Tax=Homo sapiens TaxID=9606 RepID=A0A7I2V2N3_HUMAN